MTEQLTHVLPEPPPARPKRNGRRRSRQCRGSRARNYNRAVMREVRGKPPQDTETIVAEAKATGALAAMRRQQEKAQ